MAKILIIDDDPVVLRVVESTLRRAKHEITTAADGRAAIDLLSSTAGFNLVISDANMPPGLSGFDVVRWVRSQESLKRLSVMLMTGREEKDVQLALDSGADDYIVKPVDPDLMLAKVESLLPRTDSNYKFVETAVTAMGRWNNTEVAIFGVSEQGVAFSSPLPVPDKTKIMIVSDLFELIQLGKPTLRVWSSELRNGAYHTRASFVGLNNLELQKIRVWIRKQAPGTPRSA